MGNEALSRHEISEAFGFERDVDIPIFLDEDSRFSYENLTSMERDQVILDVMKTLETKNLQKTGEHRQTIWELAWKAQGEKFSNQNFSRQSLIPDFINATPMVRFQQRYIRPKSPQFEYLLFDLFRSLVFQIYCRDVPVVYEFGCGSGFNLVALSEQDPAIRMVGLDWAEQSVHLVQEIARTQGLNLDGKQFNFYEPDYKFSLDRKGIALTVCALEQVGEQFKPFVEYLLQQKPRLCIHIEPIYEFYDPNNLLDYLAIQYHVKRNYLRGFWPCLLELEKEGRILIHKGKRLFFGSLFHEAYNYVIWEPL